MPCIETQRESYLIRLWTEDDADQPVVRGSIQNVQTGHKMFFDAIDLPVQLLRESARRLGDTEPRAALR